MKKHPAIDTKTHIVVVNDLMQKDYCYVRLADPGQSFDSEFAPHLSPREMLTMGIFGGKYLNDCRDEFPVEWFERAKMAAKGYDAKLNFFQVHASKPLSYWKEKGWIHEDDPRGWFQWYCRYYMGRRHPDDGRQIKRWKNMRRHLSQLNKNCLKGDLLCRPRQRQALLHWAYDTRR
jgi:hypothetical protein